jgi:hypothetical protein
VIKIYTYPEQTPTAVAVIAEDEDGEGFGEEVVEGVFGFSHEIRYLLMPLSRGNWLGRARRAEPDHWMGADR